MGLVPHHHPHLRLRAVMLELAAEHVEEGRIAVERVGGGVDADDRVAGLDPAQQRVAIGDGQVSGRAREHDAGVAGQRFRRRLRLELVVGARAVQREGALLRADVGQQPRQVHDRVVAVALRHRHQEKPVRGCGRSGRCRGGGAPATRSATRAEESMPDHNIGSRRRSTSGRLAPTPMTLLRVPPPLPKAVDLRRTYDAIVVGSGAAGGMAAHVLTSHGLDVLLLEAGKQIDTTAELKSMEWPYDHPRRGDMPYTSHALRGAEYALRRPPYAAKDSPWKTVHSYVQGWNGSDYSKNIVVDEKEHPYTGTSYAWVRARVPRRQDEHLGPPRPAPLRLRLQGARATTAGARTGRSRTPTSSPTTTRSTSTSASPAMRKGSPTCPTAGSSAPRASTRPR